MTLEEGLKKRKEFGFYDDKFDTQEHREKAQKIAKEILRKVGTPPDLIEKAVADDEVTYGIVEDPDDFMQWIKRSRVDTTTISFLVTLSVIFND